MKHLRRFLSVFLVAAMLVPSVLPQASAHEQERAAQNVHPFYGTEQLIQDAVEDLREQGETMTEAPVDHQLIKDVEQAGEKTYNEVKTAIVTRLQNNLGSGEIDVSDLNLSKHTLEKVMGEVLTENYLTNAIRSMTYSTQGGKVGKIDFTASEGYKAAMGAIDEEFPEKLTQLGDAMSGLLEKLPQQLEEYLKHVHIRNDVQLFGAADAPAACQRHKVSGAQVLGDLSADRVLTVKDVALVRDAIEKGTNDKAADLNRDGKVDQKDLDMLRQVIVDEGKSGYVDMVRPNFEWSLKYDFTARDKNGMPLDLMNHPEDAQKIANGGLLYAPNPQHGNAMEIQQGILPDISWQLEKVSFFCDECGQEIVYQRDASNPQNPINAALDQMVTRYNVYGKMVNISQTPGKEQWVPDMDPQTGMPKTELVPITEKQPTGPDRMLFTQISMASYADDTFNGVDVDPMTGLPVGLYMDDNGQNNDNSLQMLNYYYSMFSTFNADHADYYGVSSEYWTSKNSEADPLAALKSLCNIGPDVPVPPAVLGQLVQMIPQAFMAYVMYYGDMLLDMKGQAKAVVDALPAGATTVQKLLVLHDWVAENSVFDMGAMMDLSSSEGNPDTDPIQMTAFGALLSDQLMMSAQPGKPKYGGCICLGYASAYNLLLQDIVYPQAYKNSDGSWKTPEEVRNNGVGGDFCDFGQVMFYSNTENSSIAGEGFGGGFFNNVHYYNMVRVPEAPQTGGTKENPRTGDWFFVDVCYDDIYIECMMQYRAETEGAIHHDFFLASPLSMNKIWGESVDYISNLHDGVEFVTKTDRQGRPVPFPKDHEQYNPDKPDHPMHKTVKAPNEVGSDNTCYQDSWFSGAVSKINHDGTNWYYTDADNTTFGFLDNIKEDRDGNYSFDFSQMAKHDVKTGIHAVRADINKQPKLNARPMSAPDYWDAPKKEESNGLAGMNKPKEFKDDPHDVILVDFGTGDGKFIQENAMLKEAVKRHYNYTDQFPGLTIGVGLYQGKLYFNLGNQIFAYDLKSNKVELIKTYGTVNAATDGRKYTASSYYIDPKGQAETVLTVENNPLASLTIRPMYIPVMQEVTLPNGQTTQVFQKMQPMPMMYMDIGTNYSFTAAFEGTDNEANMQTLYTQEAHNYNGEYNHVLNRNMPADKQDSNNNSEFLWCANVRDSLPMSYVRPDGRLPENGSCAGQDSGHDYEYDLKEGMYICKKCGLHAQNIVVENEDYDIILHHQPANYRGEGLGAQQNNGPKTIVPVNDVREAAILVGGEVKKNKVELGDILVEVVPKDGTISSKVVGVQYQDYSGKTYEVTQKNKDGMYVISKPKDFGVMKISLKTVTEFHVNVNFTPAEKGTATINKPIAKPGQRVEVKLTPKIPYGVKNISVTAKVKDRVVDVPFDFEENAKVLCFDMPSGSVTVNVELQEMFDIVNKNPNLVSVSTKEAPAGERIQVVPVTGQKLAELKVINNKTKAPVELDENNFFTMPAASVTISAVAQVKAAADNEQVMSVQPEVQPQADSDPADVVPDSDEEPVHEDAVLNDTASVKGIEETDPENEPQA